MKTHITLLVLITMTFLGACQYRGQGPNPSSKANNTYQGPGDSGGGDTCNGKMIESFKVDITELDEYKEFIQPILQKTMLPKAKGGDENSPFVFAPKMKNWYIIDCKLQDIPKERKGLFLETYQTAIHTSREIFIDSSSYNKMAKEEKAKLLLHEIVMNHYLVKYLSVVDLCKLIGNCDKDVTVVSNWKMFRPEPYRPLNQEDHQKIRNVTAWLWAQGDSLNFEDFVKILKDNDFDKRFEYSGNSESSEFEVDPQVLVRMFKKYQWSKSFPKFCQFDENNVSKSTCQTQVTAEVKEKPLGQAMIKQLAVNVRVTRDSDHKTIDREYSIPMVGISGPNQKIKLYENKFGPVLKAVPMFYFANWPSWQPVTSPTEGMESQALFLMMNFSDRENPEIYQMMLQTYVWYSFEDVIQEQNGVKMKVTYGYAKIIENEGESLFVEKELPFSFQPNLSNGKTFISAVPVP